MSNTFDGSHAHRSGCAFQTVRFAKNFVKQGLTLVIGRISKSCGCTGAIVEETTVEPGGSTPLRIWLETRNRSGPIEERVVVRSNDPRTPLLELLLEATVVEETPP